MSISFSIITPVFNRSDTISRCIKSVFGQSFKDYEHIIIDDGSADQSFQIAQSYAAKDDRIKVFRFKKNRGTNAGRNFCINKATNKYILILDSDDYLVTGALEQVVQVIDNNKQFRHFLFAADDKIPYYNSNKYLNKESNLVNFELWLERNITGDFIHVVERELMLLYPFDEYIRHLEGNNFLRFYKESVQQLFTKRIVVIRDRGRPDSITLTPRFSDKEGISRSYYAVLQRLEWFADDLIHLKKQILLEQDCHVAIKLGLLLSDYKKVMKISDKFNIKMDFKEKVIYNLRLGNIALILVIFYYEYIRK